MQAVQLAEPADELDLSDPPRVLEPARPHKASSSCVVLQPRPRPAPLTSSSDQPRRRHRALDPTRRPRPPPAGSGRRRRDSAPSTLTPRKPSCRPASAGVSMLPPKRSLVPERAPGGNMDTPQMRAGTTCFLGVNVEGALFSVGDGHYRQGEGEACGTAVEGAMDDDADRRAGQGRGPRRGRGWRTTSHWMTLVERAVSARGRAGGSDRSSLSRWFGELYGLHPSGRLPAAVADQRRRRSPTSCDANYSAVLKARKSLLPPRLLAYGGLQRRAAQPRGVPALTCSGEMHMDLQLEGLPAYWSPGAPAGSAARSSRRSSTRAPLVEFCARDTADEFECDGEGPPRAGERGTGYRRCRSMSPTGRALYRLGRRPRPGGWGGRDGAWANVSALAARTHRGELAALVRGRPDAHGPAGRRRRCRTWRPAPGARSSSISSVTGRGSGLRHRLWTGR